MEWKWKKKTAFLLTSAMVLQLTACARTPAPSTKETTPGRQESAASEADTDILPAVGEELSGFTLQGAEPYGPLHQYMDAMDRDLTGFDVENLRKLAAEIKAASIDDKEQAVEVMRELLKNQHLVTVGNAELIRSEADLFDQVYDYRKPLNQ